MKKENEIERERKRYGRKAARSMISWMFSKSAPQCFHVHLPSSTLLCICFISVLFVGSFFLFVVFVCHGYAYCELWILGCTPNTIHCTLHTAVHEIVFFHSSLNSQFELFRFSILFNSLVLMFSNLLFSRVKSKSFGCIFMIACFDIHFVVQPSHIFFFFFYLSSSIIHIRTTGCFHNENEFAAFYQMM